MRLVTSGTIIHRIKKLTLESNMTRLLIGARLSSLNGGAFLSCLSLAGWLLLASFLPAQDPPDDPPQLADPPKVPGWIVEQSIYIPYEKIRSVFEKQDRGVFVPYAQFDALWKQAQANVSGENPNVPPASHLLVSANSRVVLERQLAQITTTLAIEFLKTGWQEIPLNLQNVSLKSAKIDGRDARVIKKEDGSFWLMEEVTEAPDTVELELEYALGFPPQLGQNQITLSIPRATINRWEIGTAESDVDIQVTPAAVLTTVDGETPATENLKSKIVALVGNSSEINIVWTPRSVGAEGLSALVMVSSESTVRFQKNLTTLSQVLNLDVQRATLDKLVLRPPAGFRVVNVTAGNVKRWQMDEAGTDLVVEFFEPVKGKLSLALMLEAPEEQRQNNQWRIGSVEVVNATQQPGELLIQTDPGLRAQLSSAIGLTRNDRESKPNDNPSTPITFSFVYAAVPYHAVFEVTELQPRIKANVGILAQLQPTKMTADWTVQLQITERGIYTLPLIIPESWEILQVTGSSVADHVPVMVDKYMADPENPTRWNVDLGREAIGNVALTVRLQLKTVASSLVDQPGVPVEIPLQWPTLVPGTVESSQGVLTLEFRDSLSVTTADNANYRRGDGGFGTSEGWQQVQFEFIDQPTDLLLTATRRQPRVFVDQFLQVTTESGSLRHLAELDYEIRFSPVKVLRIDIPVELESRLQLLGTEYQWQKLNPQPTDVAADEAAWEVRGPSEWLGNYRISFSWDLPLTSVDVGASQSLSIRGLQPKGADRARGQVVIKRTELFDIQTDANSQGLRPIDPTTDLFAGRRIDDAVAALEFVDRWNLGLTLSRFALYELKRTNVPKSLIRAVWLRQGELSVVATYQVQSVLQRLVIQMPPGFDPSTGFSNNAVSIDGQPVAIEQGGAGELVLNLGNRDRNQIMLLEIRYSMKADSPSIPVPTFADDCAVQATKLVVYIPQEMIPTAATGPWTDSRIEEEPNFWKRLFTRRATADNRWLAWIQTDSVPASKFGRFETDGRAYVFSTMRPVAGAAGALNIQLARDWVINLGIAGLILIVGILLMRVNFAWRWIALAIGCTALLVLSIGSPILVEHLRMEYIGLAVALVMVLWVLVAIAAGWGNRRQTPRRVDASLNPTPPTNNPSSPPSTNPPSTNPPPTNPSPTNPSSTNPPSTTLPPPNATS